MLLEDGQFEKDMLAAMEASLQSSDADPSPMPNPHHTSPRQAWSETDEYLADLDKACKASMAGAPEQLKGTCPICVEHYTMTHKLCRRRSCDHEICERCAVRLLEEPCPICRAPATEEQSFYIVE